MATRREFLAQVGIAVSTVPAALEARPDPIGETEAGSSQAIEGANGPAEGPLPWGEYWKLESRLGKRRIKMESFSLGGKRQLFIDNLIIEHMDNLKKVVHQFKRDDTNPVLKPDRPWESAVAFLSVVLDPQTGIFNAWYQVGVGLCYATSNDGLTWNKPILSRIDYEGSKANNLVLPSPGMDSPTVIRDPYDSNPDRRYKYFAKHNTPIFGMYVGDSPDGIHWKIGERPVLTSANDPGLNDRPCLMQDLEKRRFIANLKREMPNPYGRGDYGMVQRMRTVSFSSDFEKWTNPLMALKPDDRDPPELQIYGCSGFNYEGMYLGLMDTLHSQDQGPDYLTLDIQLALSRDGENWWRAGNRESVFPIGPDASWDRFRVYPSNTPPIVMGDELWLFYRGTGSSRHGPPPPDYRQGPPWYAGVYPPDEPLAADVPKTGMGLAKLRRDGFVSVDGGPRPGRLMTKPLIFDGSSELRINANAKQGRIRAALFAAEPRKSKYATYSWAIADPIPGFGFDDSIPTTGDSTNTAMRWKNGPKLDGFAGQYIVIDFEITNGSLYSFWLA